MPKETDSAIDEALESHYVLVDLSAPRGNLLFLWMTGTGGVPGRSRLFLDVVARMGLHVIDLRYPNAVSVLELCESDPETGCFEKVRLEKVDGVDRTPKVLVSRANSIENRLLKLLGYLDAKYPGQGWAQYSTGGSVNWSKVVVAGLSQGGGQAAIIAKEHLVARVVMFGAVTDLSIAVDPPKPPPWLRGPHATPLERYYAFAHAKDQFMPTFEKSWAAMGLHAFGPIVNIDEAEPPYRGSHQLTTNLPPIAGGNPPPYHISVVADRWTPTKPDGEPLFLQVWQFICCPP